MPIGLSWLNSRINAIKQSKIQESSLFLREHPGFRWKDVIQQEIRPINYLEIGVFKGENIIDMSKSYCKHPDSKMYCVDPWLDYDEYSEYKGKINTIYNEFISNVTNANILDKLIIYRDFSQNTVPTFQDNFFDIAFIDGNHETEFVYADAIMVFPKMKTGGIIVFDDYNWSQTKKGIDNFINTYNDKIKVIGYGVAQMFIQKL